MSVKVGNRSFLTGMPSAEPDKDSFGVSLGDWQAAFSDTHLALRAATALFEQASEGVMVCDRDARIVAVNSAFSAITGYDSHEVVGREPNILSSGRHDEAFYAEMWASLGDSDHWEGEIWNRRKNGEVFPEWLCIWVLRDDAGAVGAYIATFSDSTLRQFDQRYFRRQANYDALTELPNRHLMHDRIHQALTLRKRSKERAALLFIDLDQFRRINDAVGHATGDAILMALASRMRNVVGEGAVVARFGGDDFMVLLPLVSASEEATRVAQSLIEAIHEPITLENHGDVSVGASVGIAVFPDDGHDPAALMRNAAAAAEAALTRGGLRYQFFTDDLNKQARERLTLEQKLRRAIDKGEMVLHFQPKVELRQGRIVSAEALVRWNDPEQGLIPPLKFIPLAEETGLIQGLGDWVLHAACRQTKTWLDQGLRPIRMAVNVSPKQLSSGDFVKKILGVLKDTSLPAELLELEITENSLMEFPDNAIRILRDLRDHGIAVTADDFGTGYSSLSYLRMLPLRAIKIDRAFVADIDSGKEGAKLAAAVIALGQSMNLEVIAEGVETQSQVAFLRQQWCEYIQGYLFSRPVPADEFEAMIVADRRF